MHPTSKTSLRRAVRTIAAAGATALLLSACGGDGGADGGEGSGLNLINDGTLVVAMSGEFQPFSYFEGNDLTGFDYEIGEAIAEELGLEFESQTGAFDTLIGGIQANRYDVLIASMSNTPERDEAVDFSDGYYVSGAQAFVAPDTECSDITQLDSPVVGVASGTTYQNYLNEEGADWVGEVRTFSSDITALQDVATGRLDAAMTDRNVGLHQIQESDLELELCGPPLYVEEPAFAVKEGNAELQAALNDALAEIKDNGTYGEISDKYFGKDISTTEDEG